MRAELLTTQNSNNEFVNGEPASSGLSSFIEDVIGDEHFRIEQDLGNGYVRLKSSEAERRQAAQDIRSSEDALIELLRNSRDANAQNIFVALQREADLRKIVVVDDGDGIPADLRQEIFKPRVTSKLDTAHMDRWGMHGRGMALFSIDVNSESAEAVSSELGLGSAIKVVLDCKKLGEKSDQSTFPHFEDIDGTLTMRGPKNLIRTICEFAFEHRNSVNVYFGSFAECASAMYEIGIASIPPSKRAYLGNAIEFPLFKRLSFATTPEDLSNLAHEIGLEISERTSRRIMDLKRTNPLSVMERMAKESFPKKDSGAAKLKKQPVLDDSLKRKLRLDEEDELALIKSIQEVYSQIAEKHYVVKDVDIKVRSENGRIIVEIPTIEDGSE